MILTPEVALAASELGSMDQEVLLTSSVHDFRPLDGGTKLQIDPDLPDGPAFEFPEGELIEEPSDLGKREFANIFEDQNVGQIDPRDTVYAIDDPIEPVVHGLYTNSPVGELVEENDPIFEPFYQESEIEAMPQDIRSLEQLESAFGLAPNAEIVDFANKEEFFQDPDSMPLKPVDMNELLSEGTPFDEPLQAVHEEISRQMANAESGMIDDNKDEDLSNDGVVAEPESYISPPEEKILAFFRFDAHPPDYQPEPGLWRTETPEQSEMLADAYQPISDESSRRLDIMIDYLEPNAESRALEEVASLDDMDDVPEEVMESLTQDEEEKELSSELNQLEDAWHTSFEEGSSNDEEAATQLETETFTQESRPSGVAGTRRRHDEEEEDHDDFDTRITDTHLSLPTSRTPRASSEYTFTTRAELDGLELTARNSHRLSARQTREILNEITDEGPLPNIQDWEDHLNDEPEEEADVEGADSLSNDPAAAKAILDAQFEDFEQLEDAGDDAADQNDEHEDEDEDDDDDDDVHTPRTKVSFGNEEVEEIASEFLGPALRRIEERQLDARMGDLEGVGDEYFDEEEDEDAEIDYENALLFKNGEEDDDLDLEDFDEEQTPWDMFREIDHTDIYAYVDESEIVEEPTHELNSYLGRPGETLSYNEPENEFSDYPVSKIPILVTPHHDDIVLFEPKPGHFDAKAKITGPVRIGESMVWDGTRGRLSDMSRTAADSPSDSGKSGSSYDLYDHLVLPFPKDPEEDEWVVNQVVHVGRHTNITHSGRVYSFSSLVIKGNGRGTAGWGYGKAPSAPKATEMAERDCQRRMITLPLYHKTIPHDLSGKFLASEVRFFKSKHRKGGVERGLLGCIIEAFGIADATARTLGSHNPQNVVKAAFKALASFNHPVWTSRARGKKLYNVSDVHPEIVAMKRERAAQPVD